MKKYHLYNPVKNAYFNYDTIDKIYIWLDAPQTEGVQSQFTEEEIKNHKLRDILELLVREEVK